MKIEFDFNNKKRNPTLILCNPNGQELYAIGMAKDVEYSKDYNAVSELSFEIPKYKDDSIIPYYEKIQSNRLVKIEDVGVYIITDVNRSQKGTIEEYKTVDCVGLEFELSSRNLDILDGTYCLYDATGANTEKSIIHIVLSYLPNWSISEVDSDLWDVWRTFSIQDVNIYNFLMGEIPQTYDCVFLFDTFNRQIKVVKTNNLKKQSDVYLSGRNLIKELDIEESSDNLITALTVYGDGDLSIRTINPLGTATTYNFDYFMTTDWMSQELINAITSWKTKYTQSEAQFTLLLSQLKTKQNELVVLESQLTDLETARKSSEQGQSLAIANGDNDACSLYAGQLRNKEAEIANKKVEIQNKKADIDTTQNNLVQIPASLSIDNTSNFSPTLRKELDHYIKQASKQNTDYAITDTMTNDEAIKVATDLFTWGKEQLAKLSQPIWEFKLSVVNFLNLIEYKHISNQLDLGSEVVIEVDKTRDLYAYAMLIGYTIKLDSPDDIELRFSSALNFKRTSMTYDEAFQKAASISKSYDFESPSWKKGNEAYNKMNEYINQGFVDLTKDILSADNQEFTISNTGIRGREYLPETDAYSLEELRMTKNVLAFSDDGFNTTKTAIGKIKMPDGSSKFGVSGEAIIGKVFLGSNLYLETEDNSLKWDSNGLQLRNANIIITNDKGIEESLEVTLENVANKASKNLSDAMKTINQELTDLQYAITDGMSTIWYQDTEPSEAKAGDTWYDTSSKNKAYLARKGGTPSRVGEHLLCGTFFVTKDIEWLPLQDENVLDALSAAQSAQSTADGKIKTYYQTTMPTDGSYGDLWFDTDDKNKPHRHNGTTFVVVQDGAIVDAQNTATSAINKVNGIITSNGLIDTNKMDGLIQAGNNNILLGESTNRMKLNENGILITKNNGSSWDTAISAYGIVADAIQAGGTISGVTFKSVSIDSKTMTLDSGRVNFRDTSNRTGYYDSDSISLFSGSNNLIIEAYYSSSLGTGASIFAPQNLVVGNSATSAGMTFGSNGNIMITTFLNNSYVGVSADFWVAGEKDSIVPTQHYGVRTLYCEEADRAYFLTNGIEETTNNEAIITLDDIFIETIELNSSYPYIVQLTSYSDARVWVEKIDDFSFVVKSDKDTKFSYSLRAIRISFGNKYLEEKVDVLDSKQLKEVQEKAIKRMSE